MEQPPDSRRYPDVGFSEETLRLFCNALRFYAELLEDDIKAIQVDPELAKLLDEESLRSFEIEQEIKASRDMAERMEKLIPVARTMGMTEMTISHGLVRRLKAVAILYLASLEARRNNVATTRSLSTYGLKVLDTRLLQLREKLEMGVFRDAEPIPLIVAPEAALRPSVSAPAVTITATSQMAHIEIVDQELRERCLDLFNDFDESKQTHRFDTVVGEATRILEDRVRRLSGLGTDVSGVDLMKSAFGGTSPKLRLSTNASEQEGAHLLFRGVVGFIRNPVHHRLEKIERERAIQILGFIDYLLYLAEGATTDNP